MKQLALGGASFRLQAVKRGGAWVAAAEQIGARARFGIECTGASEGEALDRLAAWLAWQHEHEAALSGLQTAEGDYHRTIAGRAFAAASAATAGHDVAQRKLKAVAAARVRLDEIRARRPE